jgi:hypothetical protein
VCVCARARARARVREKERARELERTNRKEKVVGIDNRHGQNLWEIYKVILLEKH